MAEELENEKNTAEADAASPVTDGEEDDACGFEEFEKTASEWDDAPMPAAAKKKLRLPSFFYSERVLRYRYLGFAFIVPALTMWLIYIAMGTYPFGEGSVLVLDLNGQYVYFFEQLREIVLGDASLIYSWGRALGGEFMGIYAYYLASPFSFIVCLFPKKMITEALLLMFLLKTGLCGLTFGIYLDYKTPRKKLSSASVVMFSTIYALTAYAVVQQHNTMWIDNLICLPLIVMGIERMIKHGRFRLFIVSLTVAVMSNFYIGYMTCIFVFFYFFIAYATMAPEERNPLGEGQHFAKSLFRIAGSSVIVLMTSCVILWSAYYGLTFGKTTFSNPTWTLDSKFDILDLVSKLFIGSYDTVRPEGLPFVYCGSLVLLLLPIYFFLKSVPVREKLLVAACCLFFTLSFTVSAADLVWHGFQRPNWLNYRYSFILCFFMIFAAYRAFLHIREVNIRYIIGVAIAWSFVLIILQKLDTYEWISDYGTVWLTFAFFAAYIILLRFHLTSTIKGGVALAIASIVVLESFVGGLMNLLALGDDVVYSSRTSYRSFVDRVQPIVDMVQADDDSFYRMEKTLHRKTNDALALGFRGLSNSTSTLNAKTITFLSSLGLSAKSHWAKYLGGTPVVDSLLGIKYLVTEQGSNISPLYEKKYDYQGETGAPLEAYLNPYALPIAYGVDGSLLACNPASFDTPFDRLDNIVSGMLGDNIGDAGIFVPIPIDKEETAHCTVGYTTGHQALTDDASGTKGRIIYTITVDSDGEVYCYFPSDYIRKCDLYVNGARISTYYDNETYRIMDLGHHTSGEVMTVELRMDENDKLYIKMEDTYFYRLDEDAFKSAMGELSASTYEIEKYTEDSFYGKIDIKEGDELVFTSIPYDEGWVVRLDGERVDIFETMNALIGFYAEPGEHTLTMEYRPACVIYGSIVSCLGIVMFAGACVIDAQKRRRSSADAGTEADAEAEAYTGAAVSAASETPKTEDATGAEAPENGKSEKE